MIASPFRFTTLGLTVSERLSAARLKFSAGLKGAFIWVGLLLVIPCGLAVAINSLPENYYVFHAEGQAFTSLDESRVIHVKAGERLAIDGPHSAHWWNPNPSLEVSSNNNAIAKIVSDPSGQTTQIIAGLPGTALLNYQTAPHERLMINVVVSPNS